MSTALCLQVSSSSTLYIFQEASHLWRLLCSVQGSTPQEFLKMDVYHGHIPVCSSHSTFCRSSLNLWLCEDDGTCGLTVTSWGNPAWFIKLSFGRLLPPSLSAMTWQMQLATRFLLACSKLHVRAPPPPPFLLINYLHNAMKDEKPDQHLLIPFLIGARQGFLLGCWLVSGLWGILLHLNVLGLTLIFWRDTVRVTCECHKTNEKFHLDVQTRTQIIIVGNCQKYYFCRDKSFVVRNTCLSWQNTSFVRIKVCLLWQNFCCDKQFIAMKLCLLWQKFCNAKLTFATTNTFLSWQNTSFVVTKVCLLRQNNFFCHG